MSGKCAKVDYIFYVDCLTNLGYAWMTSIEPVRFPLNDFAQEKLKNLWRRAAKLKEYKVWVKEEEVTLNGNT